MKKQAHPQWSSTRAFILAATGAAVGLGNIWKFPYMAGSQGGSAFILCYFFFVICIGIPLMMGEIMLGRLTKKDPVSAIKQLIKQYKMHRAWQWLGWWGMATLFFILSFYTVVSSWALAFFLNSLQLLLHAQTKPLAWQSLLSNTSTLVSDHILFITLITWVVASGIKRGIDRAARIMMPGLFVILAILVGYALHTTGFIPSVDFLFGFKWQQINIQVLLAALGHAFFTLAIGVGCMLAYGSYLPPQTNISHAVWTIAVLDLSVALLSGLAIFPLVFTYHLSPAAGPSLMFEVLPQAFASMPFGAVWRLLFFSLLLFAAWTSSISLLEPLVMFTIEKTKLSRVKATILIALTAWIMGVPSVLSWQQGHAHHFFNYLTDFTTNFMLPIGGIGYSILIGWNLPLKVCKNALSFKHHTGSLIWHGLLKIWIPGCIAIILIQHMIG